MTTKINPALGRRHFLAGTAGATAAAVIFISGGAILQPTEAWGYQVKALTPETMRTLIQVARDIYPHDRVADRFYALAMKAHDEAAAQKPDTKALIETGVATLDQMASARFGVPYASVGWESDRLTLLREIEAEPFFQTVRGGLVTGLYNNQELWPLFGYEGESAAKGGYLDRGFDDVEWL